MNKKNASMSTEQNLSNPCFFIDPGDELRDLVPGYIQKRIIDIEYIKGCLDQLNYAEIRRVAHMIKGHAQSFGFLALGELMNKLQTFQDCDYENKNAILSELNMASNELEKLKSSFDQGNI